MLKFALFALLALPYLAEAYSPSGRSCEFYRELEARVNCGPEGYPLSFGYRMCELYRKEESDESAAIKKWFPKIRYCLQDYLYKNAHRARNCSELKKMAIDSHVDCYVQTGYCDLGPASLARILYLTGTNALSMDVARVGTQVSGKCLAMNSPQQSTELQQVRRGRDY